MTRVRSSLVTALAGLAALAGLGLLAGACASDPSTVDDDTRPLVMATTSIVADVVASVAGDSVRVVTLIGPGIDGHDAQPSARQVTQMSGADLIVAVGGGLEGGYEDAIDTADDAGVDVVRLAPSLRPRALPDGSIDPHVWMDPSRMVTATGLIAERLKDLAPDDAAAIDDRAAVLAGELLALDAQTSEALSALSDERRRIGVTHDALAYLAERYSLQIAATAVPALAAGASPSAADIVEMAATLRSAGARVLVTDRLEGATLARTIAAETGADVTVVELWIEALAPDGEDGPTTYLDLIAYDLDLLVDALTAGAVSVP